MSKVRNGSKTLALGFHPYDKLEAVREKAVREEAVREDAPRETLASKLLGGNFEDDELEKRTHPYAAALKKITRNDEDVVKILGLKPAAKKVSNMFNATKAMLVDPLTKIATRGAEMLKMAIDKGSLLAVQVLLMAGADPKKEVPGTEETLYDYGKRRGTKEIRDRLDVWHRSQAKKRTE